MVIFTFIAFGSDFEIALTNSFPNASVNTFILYSANSFFATISSLDPAVETRMIP